MALPGVLGAGFGSAERGTRIVNARGVPGTLGFLAVIPHYSTAVLVSNHHVLFGAGALACEPVWLAESGRDGDDLRRVGHSLYGTLGTVRYGRLRHHVDCAVATVQGAHAPRPGWYAGHDDAATATPAPGMAVVKTGAVTGTTHGVITDVAYPAVVLVDGHTRAAPGQLLVRSTEDGAAFSAAGDSGAVLRDRSGAAVGLLWGANHRGEGIACDIRPVLKALGVCPLPSPPGRRGASDAVIR